MKYSKRIEALASKLDDEMTRQQSMGILNPSVTAQGQDAHIVMEALYCLSASYAEMEPLGRLEHLREGDEK